MKLESLKAKAFWVLYQVLKKRYHYYAFDRELKNKTYLCLFDLAFFLASGGGPKVAKRCNHLNIRECLYVGNPLHICVKRLHLLATLATFRGQKML
jgi:hypothetical protein